MCGFVGMASRNKLADQTWLLRGAEMLGHRGPDQNGLFLSEDLSVGLAHRRLAIVDLSVAGRQPMRNKAMGATLVFNGEIYNYKELKEILTKRGCAFKSASDTELFLQETGRVKNHYSFAFATVRFTFLQN